jgi:hypothetical protein
MFTRNNILLVSSAGVFGTLFSGILLQHRFCKRMVAVPITHAIFAEKNKEEIKEGTIDS